jgi:hypothetical protein
VEEREPTPHHCPDAAGVVVHEPHATVTSQILRCRSQLEPVHACEL